MFPKRPEVGLTREQKQSRQLHGNSRSPAVSGYAKRGDTPNQISLTGFDGAGASASAIPASAEPFRPACSYPKPPTRRTSQAAHVFFNVPVRIVAHVAQWLGGGRRVRLPLRPIRPRTTWPPGIDRPLTARSAGRQQSQPRPSCSIAFGRRRFTDTRAGFA